MAFRTRIFFYPGVVDAIRPLVVQNSTDSVQMLREPYLLSDNQQSNGATEVTFAAAPAGTKIAYVEVDDGNAIRYEVRMGPNKRTAGTNSRKMSGFDAVFVSEGAVFAWVDASAV